MKENKSLGLTLLSPLDFELITNKIYKKSGLVFKDTKHYLIENRVSEHMKNLGITNLDKYIRLISSEDDIIDELIDKVTTNETYFYREYYHLKLLSQIVQNNEFKTPIKVLSIPTSTGEEPYSISIVLTEVLGDSNLFSIVGADINKYVLNQARKAIYGNRSVSKLPNLYLKRYFKYNDNYYHLLPKIKNNVTFKLGNITDKDFMENLGKFHYIFCKNLFIYFDDISENKAINYLYDALYDGGYLFLGHSETISKTTNLFEPIKIDNTIIYRKIKE